MEVDKGTQDAQRSHKTNTPLVEMRGKALSLLCTDGRRTGRPGFNSWQRQVFFRFAHAFTPALEKNLTFYSKRPERRADHSPTYIVKFFSHRPWWRDAKLSTETLTLPRFNWKTSGGGGEDLLWHMRRWEDEVCLKKQKRLWTYEEPR
jgi:hypothetical protein